MSGDTSPGSRIGAYDIIASLGHGGMGEVYRARDTQLGRDVALKMLPATFTGDPERVARLRREAQVLASLNHPHIAQIYGLQESSGTHVLVLELVDGESLDKRLARGAIPVDEALEYARQIAEALEAAHEKGIVHRDVKPANVALTQDGQVKVLDFGLAKSLETTSGSPVDAMNSPTITSPAQLSAVGTLLGTAAYMSPEQAKGRPADKRSDIWAFGCVLYEMLTGRRAFEGDDVAESLSRVLQREPEWARLPQRVPPRIHDLLRLCLAKNPRNRRSDATDVRLDIEQALRDPAGAAPGRADGGRHAERWAVAAMSTFILGGLAVWLLKPSPAASPQRVTRTVITLPQGDQLAASAVDALGIAISPDGTQLAYVAIHAGTRQLFLRALDRLDATPLPGTEDAAMPFFSTDGQWLGFFAGGQLKKLSVRGGTPVTLLTSVAAPGGATWSRAGEVIFSPAIGSPLQRIPDAGGTPDALTHLEKGEVTHGWPAVLPTQTELLFTVNPTDANPRVVVQSLTSGERHDLVLGGTFPHYATTGHVLYVQADTGTVMAVPFDRQRLQLTGAAVPVVDGVLPAGIRGGAQLALSDTGSLVYVPGSSQTLRRLVWVTRNGQEQVVAAPPRAYIEPRLSPDGRRIAVSIQEEGGQLWLYDGARDTLSRFSLEGSANYDSTWTPDGTHVAFDSTKDGPRNIFWQRADGSAGPERLTTSEYFQVPRSFDPTGQLLAFTQIHPTTGYDIWVLRLSDHTVQPFLRTPFNEGAPRFSPDGHWLAYVSDESGRWEVYVQPYPGPGGKWLISQDGGTEPVWNPSGNELFYRHGNTMMAVDVTTQPGFAAGKPRMLFQRPYVPTTGTVPFYDVSLDGQRFLMIKESDQAVPLNQIVVVQNWFTELKQRVPTR